MQHLLTFVCYRVYTRGKSEMGRQMTERIAITEEVKALVNEFREGANMTYDDALQLMIYGLRGGSEGDLGTIAATLNYARKSGKKISGPRIVGE